MYYCVLFPACTPLLFLPLSVCAQIFILCLSPVPHFLFSSVLLLFLCTLADLSVGCSYLNLTLILLMELLSAHQRKEGIGEQSEISGRNAKEQYHKVYIKSPSKLSWVYNRSIYCLIIPCLYLLAKIFTVRHFDFCFLS